MATNGAVSLTGQDTISINGRIFNNLGSADVARLTYPNNIAEVKTGKNGNSIYALNTTGFQSELLLKVIRGSADDQFLNNLYAEQKSSFSTFVLMYGEFVKVVGDGAGNTSNDTYVVGGGLFMKGPEALSNVEGNTDQGETEWHFKFANTDRAIT